MKKVLIYLQEGCLAKTGGPIGYNYALKTQLDKAGVTNIDYLPGGHPFVPGIGRKIKNTWYGKILKNISDFILQTKLLYGPSKKPIVDINEYDVIHFHGCAYMYAIRKSLENYKGTVVLTSHSPRVWYLESIGRLTEWAQKHLFWYYKRLERIDKYAFNRADTILFPCPEAEEPYFNTWPEYPKIKKSKNKNFRYLLTGTYKCTAKLSREDVLSKYGIPLDSFVVCYVGRHNEIKGYDKLKEIGRKVLDKIPNAYFLIAGEEYPIKGLDDKRWIEAGWTNDPHSIIAASNLFVLPNKETYFDLVLLEVLSLGKIVVASETGGNKHFVGKLGDGFHSYKTCDEAVKSILKISQMSDETIGKIEIQNAKYFDENLSLDIFGRNYIKFYDDL